MAVYYWLPSDTEDMGPTIHAAGLAPPRNQRTSTRSSSSTQAPQKPIGTSPTSCAGATARRRTASRCRRLCCGARKEGEAQHRRRLQLMTGGAGGIIKFWSAPKDEDPLYDSAAAACSPLFMVELEARAGAAGAGIKALDTLAKGKGELLWVPTSATCGGSSSTTTARLRRKARAAKLGTGGGKGIASLKWKGHRKDVEGLDCHPTYEGVFGVLRVRAHLPLGRARAPSSPRACSRRAASRAASKLAFRPDGARLAVGTRGRRLHLPQ